MPQVVVLLLQPMMEPKDQNPTDSSATGQEKEGREEQSKADPENSGGDVNNTEGDKYFEDLSSEDIKRMGSIHQK